HGAVRMRGHHGRHRRKRIQPRPRHTSSTSRTWRTRARFDTLARAFEEILTRGHLPPHDSGVMLYNLACYEALACDTDDARRLLQTAFSHRQDLLTNAKEDPDLATLREELESLAEPA